MKKEDIEAAAKLLTDLKDSIDELESALKGKSLNKVAEVKTKIMNLQMQIGKMI